jgi:hypothetical protein
MVKAIDHDLSRQFNLPEDAIEQPPLVSKGKSTDD